MNCDVEGGGRELLGGSPSERGAASGGGAGGVAGRGSSGSSSAVAEKRERNALKGKDDTNHFNNNIPATGQRANGEDLQAGNTFDGGDGAPRILKERCDEGERRDARRELAGEEGEGASPSGSGRCHPEARSSCGSTSAVTAKPSPYSTPSSHANSTPSPSPSPSSSFSPYLPDITHARAAPRCYCILSRRPCFELHFEVLRM